jgi:hypothetical protein
MSAAATLAVCVGLLGGGAAQPLPSAQITLWWVHSVEKIRWEEHWTATPQGLVAGIARIRGSGAGMEPPPDAQLIDGWYVYQPPTTPRPDLVLPDSDFAAPAMVCAGKACAPLAQWAGRKEGETTPIRITPCTNTP